MRIKQIVQKKDWVFIILTVLLGSLNHFLYEWTDRNPFTALITPVNESTWEHLKLLFFPFLLFTILEYYISRPRRSGFFTSRLVGVLAGMLSIVLLFYGYTAILGKNYLFLDILTFIIGVVVSYVISGFLYAHPRFKADPLIIFLAWFFVVLLFFIFTCYPPDCFLFFPPAE